MNLPGRLIEYSEAFPLASHFCHKMSDAAVAGAEHTQTRCFTVLSAEAQTRTTEPTARNHGLPASPGPPTAQPAPALDPARGPRGRGGAGRGQPGRRHGRRQACHNGRSQPPVTPLPPHGNNHTLNNATLTTRYLHYNYIHNHSLHHLHHTHSPAWNLSGGRDTRPDLVTYDIGGNIPL